MDAQQLLTSYRQSSPIKLNDEIKEHLRFLKVKTGTGDEWIDLAAEMRIKIVKLLYGSAIGDDLPLLHFMIEQEALYCAEIWSSTDTLYDLAATIFYLGDLSSLPVLWQSKNTSFDTYAVIGSREFFGAGVEKTMIYLETADFPEKDELHKYLQEELATKPIRESVDKLRNRLAEKFSSA